MPRPYITQIESRASFLEMLKHSPGHIFVKFGADWCAPCKEIGPYLMERFENMGDDVQCILVDVDESVDLYAFLKMKKMVQGIPTVLYYAKDNTSYIPNEMCNGTNAAHYDQFFHNCLE
jgi:thiol:disulfide interchange protein